MAAQFCRTEFLASSPYSQNVMIRRYVQQGENKKAVAIFEQLLHNEVLPDKFSFVNVFSACSKEKLFHKGKIIHSIAVTTGMDSDVMVHTAVLNMYGKCGSPDDALRIFKQLPERDVVSWNSIISVCANYGCESECYQLFLDMHQACSYPDYFTFVGTLNSCASSKHLANGQQLHVQLTCYGYLDEVRVATSLINMYSKCSCLEKAREVFNEMSLHDLILWNAMMSGYAHHGFAQQVFDLFNELLSTGLMPNNTTFVIMLDSCATARCLSHGHGVHFGLIRLGFEMDIVIGTALVNLYCKCGHLNDALNVFNCLPQRNSVTWNSLIKGYISHSLEREALSLLAEMLNENINPDQITFASLLKACIRVSEVDQLYGATVEIGIESNSSLLACVMETYGMFDRLDDSYRIFEKFQQKDTKLWMVIISLYSKHGSLFKACELLYNTLESHSVNDSSLFSEILAGCTKHAALPEGKWTHFCIVFCGLNTNITIVNSLINMYAKCGSLEDAHVLFEGMLEKNEISWTSMLGAYNWAGHDNDAIQLVDQMYREKLCLDNVALVKILDTWTRSGDISRGIVVHTVITLRGVDVDICLANALINMYGKCSKYEDAAWVFGHMSYHDVVTWNTIISVYSRERKLKEALECFEQMNVDRLVPDECTFIAILDACFSKENIVELMWVHNLATVFGVECRPHLVISLIDKYGKLGRTEDAQWLFTGVSKPDAMVWHAMIQVYVQQGRIPEALEVLAQMCAEGVTPDITLYANIMNAEGMLIYGKELHSCLTSAGFENDVILSTTLISMYGKCHSFEDAYAVFCTMEERDVISWNAIIGVALENQCESNVLHLFEDMLETAMLPNSVTFLHFINACSRYRNKENGNQIHACILYSTASLNTTVWNGLLSMYGGYNNVIDARAAFHQIPERDLISWNTMIKIYNRTGLCWDALQTKVRMEMEGWIPDNITFISILDACGNMGTSQGRLIHTCIIDNRTSDVTVNNSVVNMYIKCDSLWDALIAFNLIHEKDVSSWNSIISGYSRHGHSGIAFQLLNQMLEELIPDRITFATILSVCADGGRLTEGHILHQLISTIGCSHDVLIGNALINMYGKCGALIEAEHVFHKIEEKNTATYNNMIMVYSIHACTGESFHLFSNILCQESPPNEITFVSMLDICASIASTDKGRVLHMLIIQYGHELDNAVATSLVNMYSKCGILEDALHIFKTSCKKELVMWTALISAYTVHGCGIEALVLFVQMQEAQLMVDKVSLISILSVCSHTGLLEEGQHCLCYAYLENEVMEISEVLECIIDLFARIGRLQDSEEIINLTPLQPSVVSWTALFGACQNLGDIDRASRVISYIQELDSRPLHMPYVCFCNRLDVASSH